MAHCGSRPTSRRSRESEPAGAYRPETIHEGAKTVSLNSRRMLAAKLVGVVTAFPIILWLVVSAQFLFEFPSLAKGFVLWDGCVLRRPPLCWLGGCCVPDSQEAHDIIIRAGKFQNLREAHGIGLGKRV